MCGCVAHICTKSVLCMHLHAHFQSTFHTRNSAPALVRAHAHTNGLLIISPTSPDFLLKFMKTPIQSIFIHFGQIWSILDRSDPLLTHMIQSHEKKKLSFLSSCHKALHISWKSDSFVIMNCWQLWQRKLLRLTIFATTFGSFFCVTL